MSSDSNDPRVELSRGEALRRCTNTTCIDEVIELTKHSDPYVRQRALKEMCPCRSKKGIDDFWARVLEMRSDPNIAVRFQVRYCTFGILVSSRLSYSTRFQYSHILYKTYAVIN